MLVNIPAYIVAYPKLSPKKTLSLVPLDQSFIILVKLSPSPPNKLRTGKRKRKREKGKKKVGSKVKK